MARREIQFPVVQFSEHQPSARARTLTLDISHSHDVPYNFAVCAAGSNLGLPSFTVVGVLRF